MKTGLSFKEQVELLMKKGLIVNNIDDATTVLSRVNYYKLSGYSLHLKNNDVFMKIAHLIIFISCIYLINDFQRFYLTYLKQLK